MKQSNPNSRAETRSIVINFRLTQEELDTIKAGMEKSGIKHISTYIRKRVREGILIKVDMSCFEEPLKLVRALCDKTNQCAKLANETGEIRIEDIKEMQAQQKEIIKLFEEILGRFDGIKQ